MRLSNLRNKPVRTLDGKRLGRVHEVHCERGRVAALIAGAGSFIERLTAKDHGRRIPWECVTRVESGVIIVSEDPAQRSLARKPRSRKPSPSPPR